MRSDGSGTEIGTRLHRNRDRIPDVRDRIPDAIRIRRSESRYQNILFCFQFPPHVG